MVEKSTAFDDKNDEVEIPLVSAEPEEDISPTPSAPSQEDLSEGIPHPSEEEAMNSTPAESESESPHESKKVAAGATGAVFGFLLGGPILSALLGFGAAYVSQKDGASGDAARALGDVGVSIKAKASEVDEKHQIVERTSQAASEAWENAQQYDGRHQVLNKTRDFTVKSWFAFSKWVREEKLLERGVDGVGRGYEYVAERVTREET